MGGFSVPCVIGTMSFEIYLCDLGESMSLTPLLVYEKVGLSRMKYTRIFMHLAYRLAKYLIGIMEDMQITIGKPTTPTLMLSVGNHI